MAGLFDLEGNSPQAATGGTGLFGNSADFITKERDQIANDFTRDYEDRKNPFRMLGGALKTYNLQNSPEVQQMRDTDTIIQQIDIKSPEEVKVGYDELMKIGNVKGALGLLKAHNEFVERPDKTAGPVTPWTVNGVQVGTQQAGTDGKVTYTKNPELKGDVYQLIRKDKDGNNQQLKTQFVKEGENLPEIEAKLKEGGAQWAKIGTGREGPLATANIDGAGGDKFYESLNKKLGESFDEEMVAAEGLVKSLESQKEALKLIDNGIITGFGAKFLLGFGSATNQIGLTDDETVANTQAYMANQATQVAQIIKAFGAGTGLSDADRIYAERAAGGDITMDEAAIRKIIFLNNKYSRMGIEKYNKKARQVMANEDYKAPFDLVKYLPEENMAGGVLYDVRENPSVEELKAKAQGMEKGSVYWFIDRQGNMQKSQIQ